MAALCLCARGLWLGGRRRSGLPPLCRLTARPAPAGVIHAATSAAGGLTRLTSTSFAAAGTSSAAAAASAQLPSAADDERFMRLALAQAELAYQADEVPVGAVLISPAGEVLAAAHNRTETAGDPTAHAELLCIRQAAAAAGGWRLLDATLYVTLEPCPMCAGALLQSRVGTVVYGARNRLLGADGSWIAMLPRQQTDESAGCSKQSMLLMHSKQQQPSFWLKRARDPSAN
ncbi:tRNA-specific adenosine deaminase [Chlorella sorokiniana]|uniref:tRNA(adenine(34)) deaminase n=1 Tax=Chlorella sorokiniana TaxID=3076 RepID=A0A2P6TZ66_CHLSO|nr:tRNA-specific adenosine deaminase [Chlorella sorokiniana]|eukprot:PRW59358.1 tRNA-specific adenosine deaminase [Chlorella sorokiniana]